MTTKDDGGPAFPSDMIVGHSITASKPYSGMSLRQYAAIKLCVPDSGLDWLDAMILQSQRDAFAGQAVAGCGEGWFGNLKGDPDEAGKLVAKWSYETADDMQDARKGGAE